MKTIKAKDIHAGEMAEDPAYRRAYDALEDEFVLMNELIRAHMRAHLSQAEIASRTGTA